VRLHPRQILLLLKGLKVVDFEGRQELLASLQVRSVPPLRRCAAAACWSGTKATLLRLQSHHLHNERQVERVGDAQGYSVQADIRGHKADFMGVLSAAMLLTELAEQGALQAETAQHLLPILDNASSLDASKHMLWLKLKSKLEELVRVAMQLACRKALQAACELPLRKEHLASTLYGIVHTAPFSPVLSYSKGPLKTGM
jgi:hypothetical protein